MKVLITGAGGQLGTDLIAHGTAAGDDVAAVAHADLDVADRDAVLQCIGAVRPDVVVHAGAWTNVDGCETDPQRAYLINAFGTRNVAEGCARSGAHLVYVSTDYVFDGRGGGPNGGEPYSEWDQPAPRCHYGRSKWGGEQEAARLLGPAATIARTSWVCGPHGHNFVKTMLRVAANGETTPVTVVDDQLGRPTFTADLAAALRRLAVGRIPGTFHLSNPSEVTWFGFARAVFAAAGHDPERVVAITSDQLLPARPAPRPAYSVLGDTAWTSVGFAPLRPWSDALTETVCALRTS